MNTAISIKSLTKRYGKTLALDNLSLDIPKGKIFGLLGPNGAGKTTLIKILSTLISYEHGHITMYGYDLKEQPDQIRKLIGLAGQYAAIDENLTGYENLYMIARLYHFSRKESKEKAQQALEKVSLTQAGNKLARTYSGGMRRRLDLAASFINQPEILFLDEPTEGLDAHSRRELWEVIREMVKNGTTVILTTHFLEEADQLAERIAIVDKGKVLIEGINTDIKKRFGHDILKISCHSAKDTKRISELLKDHSALPPRQPHSKVLELDVKEGTKTLMQAVKIIEEHHISIKDIQIKQPTLDDVFTKITRQ